MKLKFGLFTFFVIFICTTVFAQTPIVGPLIQTKWGGGAPLDSFVPMDGDRRTAIGCVAIAMAQIMNYHQHPVRGTGQSTSYSIQSGTVPVVSFDVNYDWNNMLNVYPNATSGTGSFAVSTQQQRDAAAMLMYHVGVSIRMNYLVGGSAPSGIVARALVDNFGYDRSIQALRRAYFDNDAEYEAIIRSQLDAGLPVQYYGASPSGVTHNFIIDGYDDTGRFHVNYGYSGRGDGWYFLNNMYQSLNLDQSMRINIKPDEGGTGNNEIALLSLAANKSSVSQNEMFTVTVQFRGVSYFSGGQLGVALVDNNNRIAAVAGNINYSALEAGANRTSTINCFVPETLAPGRYQLRMVLRPAGEEWKVITRSMVREGVHNVMPFAVTAGAANSGGYGMGLMSFNTDKNTVSQNEQFTVTFMLRNMGEETFPGGQSGVALVNNGVIVGDVMGIGNSGERSPGGTTATITRNCTVPNTVAAGLYQLRIVIRTTGNEWRIATMSANNVPTSINFTVR